MGFLLCSGWLQMRRGKLDLVHEMLSHWLPPSKTPMEHSCVGWRRRRGRKPVRGRRRRRRGRKGEKVDHPVPFPSPPPSSHRKIFLCCSQWLLASSLPPLSSSSSAGLIPLIPKLKWRRRKKNRFPARHQHELIQEEREGGFWSKSLTDDAAADAFPGEEEERSGFLLPSL